MNNTFLTKSEIEKYIEELKKRETHIKKYDYDTIQQIKRIRKELQHISEVQK